MRRNRSIFALAAIALAGCGPSDPLAEHRAALGETEPTDEAIVRLSMNAPVMDATRKLFITHCATCHNASGTGLTCPNLTDDFYLNMDTPEDFYEIITYGRHAEGMPAWQSKLDESERLALAAYALQLRGTAEGGRAPEGDRKPHWETFLPGEAETGSD